MTWEVHEVHGRLYPDQGWTPAKVILEDEKHLHDADHPDANGCLFGIFVILDRMKGRDRGFFLIANRRYPYSRMVDSFAPRMRAYFGDNFGATAFNPGTLDGVRERKRELGVTKSVNSSRAHESSSGAAIQ